MTDWSPSDYLKFADERSRPVLDLLQRVPLQNPSMVYDLGCGPGNSTEFLLRRFPTAEVIGVDHSPAMIEAARAALPSTRFEQADLNTWKPQRNPDLFFSNATLQWLPDHVAVMQRLLGSLAKGGILAVQMPDNLNEPSHKMMRETAQDVRWKNLIDQSFSARADVLSPSEYYDALKPFCIKLEMWHTVYNHCLSDVSAIVEMFQSTGLRPFLAPLNDLQKFSFLNDYETRLAQAYHKQNDGSVLLRFPRIFIIATG